MNLRQITSLKLLAAILLGFVATVSTADDRPNVVIILVDDMGYSDIGCYGGEIETPNIDRLASGGLRFTQFHNAGRCCPTRASLMTGLHPHQVGIGHMTEPPERPLGFEGAYQGYLNQDCTTLAQVAKSAGYRTIMAGKWHLGFHEKHTWPLERGFDRFYGCLAGGFNYFNPSGNRVMVEGSEVVETDDDFYATDTLTDKACQYISESRQGDAPFFLYLAYNAPHWPLNSKWEEFQKYRGRYTAGWKPLMKARFDKQVELGFWDADMPRAEHVGPKWESLTDKQRDDLDARMAAYAGCIDSIDQNVGKLTEHLRELGELDNTIIFFLSDNGSCQEGGPLGRGDEAMVKNPPEGVGGVRLGMAWANASNTPFRLYKHFVHEGGACTPMIAHWPAGIPVEDRGELVRQFAYLPDFMATLLDISGGAYPTEVPAHVGKSLLETLKGQRTPVHVSPIYWEHEGNAAMRDGDWKLVREYKKPWELYNLSEDRCELEDLSESDAERRNSMVQQWEAWASEHSVAFPERFNMYEFLKQQEKPAKNKK